MHNLRLADRAAAAAARIEGWLSDRQGRALLAAVLATSGRGAIVEVGSWKGRSTVWLAFGARERGRRVIAVDPHRGSREDPSARTLDAFLANLASAGVADAVEPRVMTSVQAVQTIPDPVELLFVDGDHTEAGARLDADLWLPKVLAGGTVLFHDVATSGYTGPRRVFQQRICWSREYHRFEKVGSMMAARKLDAAATAGTVACGQLVGLLLYLFDLQGILKRGLRRVRTAVFHPRRPHTI